MLTLMLTFMVFMLTHMTVICVYIDDIVMLMLMMMSFVFI